MAKLDDLIAQVSDAKLRRQLEEAAAELRRRKKFGLVFEQHIPETTVLPEAMVRKGSVVMIRTEPANRTRYVVDAVDGNEATISAAEEAWTIPIADLLVVKPFGEPVYPVLKAFGEPLVRDPDKPFHTVINGENFHALQVLLFGYEGNVDCIYIDPPYNTGARDWKYNNDFVDRQDSWRHSKWLSFMDKRLRLAGRLLKPDGVLIVTIDEHEFSHLGMLLESVFPQADRQMVTIVINPKGVTRPGTVRFSRVEEYAYFCFFGDSGINGRLDDYLTNDISEDDPATAVGARPRWKGLLRSGSDARRVDRADMFYPVLIDVDRGAAVGTGEPLLEGDPDLAATVDGLSAAWPVRSDGSWGRWGVGHLTLRRLISEGFVSVGAFDDRRRTWPLSYLSEELRSQLAAGVLEVVSRDEPRNVVDVRYTGESARRIKSVWHRTRHDAGAGGSDVLRSFLGSGRLFDFPKSIYAVRDTLAAVTRERPDAIILDFFAGSGTTLHSTCMLNAEDGGARRCILVTNNEVEEKQAATFYKSHVFRGDPEFEAHGIFQQVTRPRCEAAITGRRQDGMPVPGEYIGGRSYADGFSENLISFDLRYADPDLIDVGASFDEVLPALWFAAGCHGDPTDLGHVKGWLLSSSSRFAVLLDEDQFRAFRSTLADHPEISHVWLVTDSEAAFARMREGVGAARQVGMLYRDYLRNFQVNVGPSVATGDLS